MLVLGTWVGTRGGTRGGDMGGTRGGTGGGTRGGTRGGSGNKDYTWLFLGLPRSTTHCYRLPLAGSNASAYKASINAQMLKCFSI